MSFVNWDIQAARIHGRWDAVRERLAKATGDITTSDLSSSGGYLSTADAEMFWKEGIEESVLVKMGTIAPMKSHTQKFPRIGFNSMISHRQASGTALPQALRAKPDLGNVNIATDEYTAEVDIPDDVVEDNIEGEAFKNLVFGLARKRIMADIEYLGLVSDTSSATSDLAGFDGVIVSITSNTVNFSGVGTTRAQLKKMLAAQPVRNKQDKSRLRFVTSPNAVEYYEDQIAQLNINLAATMYATTGQTDLNPGYGRIPLLEVPVMPENIGTGSNKTVILLGDPKGIYWGFWRQIKVEFQREAREKKTVAVFSYRFAANVANESEWTKGYDVAPAP